MDDDGRRIIQTGGPETVEKLRELTGEELDLLTVTFIALSVLRRL